MPSSNPFLIEPPASIGFSTGRTSAYMLYKIIEAYGGVDKDKIDGSYLPEGIEVNFQNMGKEREESLQFGHEIEVRWNVRINWMEYNDSFRLDNYRKSDGSMSSRRKAYTSTDLGLKQVDFNAADRIGTPYRKIIEYYCEYRKIIKKLGMILPNPTSRMCTAFGKIKVNKRFMTLVKGYDFYNALVGIRYDEPSRYHKMMQANMKGNEKYDFQCPLYDAKITREDVMKFWSQQSFDLRLDPKSDEGNCDLCFLKRTDKLIKIMQKTKEYDEFWLWAESYTGETFSKNKPSFHQLRKMIDGNDPKLVKIMARAEKTEKVIDCICGSD